MTVQFDLIIIGHFALDRIFRKNTSHTVRLGGPPYYSAISAKRLGIKVAVLSKIGEDFPQGYLKILRNEGIDVSLVRRIENAKTTSFSIRYLNKNRRKMRLEALGPKILVEDIPINIKAKIVHVAPIANEIPPETFRKIQEITEMICMDPQGYTREFGKNGSVKLRKWRDKEVLEAISIYKSDIDEIVCVSGYSDLHRAMRKIAEYGVETVIVTMGDKGAALLHDEKFYEIPAYPVSKVADPTGAGDAFIGAYLAEHIKGGNVTWCACVGSAASSFLVERKGLRRFGFKDEIYRRAKEIYEKVISRSIDI